MQIIEKLVTELAPYYNNPRQNEKAVGPVASSIATFGFKVPIVIDKNGVIIAGHTRWLAAQQLGMDRVPCIIADDLTPEQVKAFRLADNKVGELADWVPEMLAEELGGIFDIDMSEFGFNLEELTDDWFESHERNDTSHQEGNDKYNEFLDKFEAKKTTDDCYTPDVVYDVVADWVEKEYGVDRRKFVRPFYPGGDYQKEKYPDGAVVVDNPPFSILSQILNFYHDKGIKFFLFAPTLTLFSSSSSTCCAIPTGASVVYENGASVNTSFLTNLEDPTLRIRTAPALYEAVQKASDENRKDQTKELPRYSYPDEVITAALAAKWAKHGIEFRLTTSESVQIDELDAQKTVGKAIFGKGYLISQRMAQLRHEAEAAAKAHAAEAALRHAQEAHEDAELDDEGRICWQLSERERAIVRSLGDGQETVENKN